MPCTAVVPYSNILAIKQQTDRPILPPGMYYPPGFAGNDDKSWGKQYTNVRYDAWTKAYICEADHKLVDGGQFCKFRAPPPFAATFSWEPKAQMNIFACEEKRLETDCIEV